ncbi:MAG: family NAD(P)-dependent oxidoreductase [Ilumatobacteraceae bacterium]|nr:family NAD(P)-dependent oxidoreductase [Ilumatobacteraceae bacterium]
MAEQDTPATGMRFAGQVAVVTGGARGIGREYSLLLAAEGASVVVNDLGGDRAGVGADPGEAQRVVDEITSAGGIAVADGHDVALDGAGVIATALAQFGRIDLVVNNAGISGGGRLDQIPPADFDRMLAVHLGGTLAVCRAAWPHLRAQGFGRVVNTSSASVFGLGGTSAYITAKAAIFGLTRAIARDGIGDGIVVNAVMPSAYSRLTAQSPEFAPVMEAGFPAGRIAPFVGALLAREVPCHGETFVVGGGRAARVVLATVPGMIDISTIDDCLQRFDDAMSLDDLFVPADAVAAVVYECQRIGLDLSAFAAAD